MNQPSPLENDQERIVDADVLADRRARRAELAEAEMRERLAGAEQRVAELEQLAELSKQARAELEQRSVRDLRIANLLGEAANAVGAAREAVEQEIYAREAAEAACRAERIAREAAEQVVLAERAARDAATAAVVSARIRQTGNAALPVEAPRPAAAGGAVGGAAGGATAPSAVTPGTEQLVAGLALAAERLRAQAPQGEDRSGPAAPADVAAPAATPSLTTAAPRSGGLVGRAARALRKLRSERP